MMRSMFAGVSGLRNHQIRMDVIGNNIANVNTVAFKASRTNFQEVFSQTLRGASSPSADRGGTNPIQVGLGMSVAAIDSLQTQGNLQTTGKMTDLALQGSGFFVLDDGGVPVYSRSGAFDLDADGYLINPSTGMKVQGWMATAGVFPTKDQNNLSAVQVSVGQTIPARATQAVGFGGNLDSSTATGTEFVTAVDVYDSKGQAHTLTLTFTKAATPNEWTWQATASTMTITGGGSGTVTFTSAGAFDTGGGVAIAGSVTGADNLAIMPSFAAMTQFASAASASAIARDGYPAGTLQSFTIDTTGTITGIYSNGLTQKLAQIAVASFPNPGGLLKRGESLYEESNNSGFKQIGEPGTAGRGAIAPGTIEMSNVDLSQQFTEMIVTQRGFQANSRIITTSDELLQELVNLKR